MEDKCYTLGIENRKRKHKKEIIQGGYYNVRSEITRENAWNEAPGRS